MCILIDLIRQAPGLVPASGKFDELEVWILIDHSQALGLVPGAALADAHDAADTESGTDCNGEDQNTEELVDGLFNSRFNLGLLRRLRNSGAITYWSSLIS